MLPVCELLTKPKFRYWPEADQYAQSLKDPQIALERLRRLYTKFDAKERVMADQVLAEWVLSDDEAMRFDAIVLIHDFRIETAAPALRLLRDQLTLSKSPGAPFEKQRVERLLSELIATAQGV